MYILWPKYINIIVTVIYTATLVLLCNIPGNGHIGSGLAPAGAVQKKKT